MPVPNARDRLPSPDAFKVGTQRQDEFLLLFGVTHRVRRLAQAYLRLRKGDFEVEGQILVRSALEHAVTAQWAYVTKGGMERLKVSGTTDQYTFVKLLAEYSSDPAAPQQVDALDSDVYGDVTLKLKPDARIGHETFYTLSSACMLSAWIVADLEGLADEFSRLKSFSEQLSIPYRLDASLAAEVRRFDDVVAYGPA